MTPSSSNSSTAHLPQRVQDLSARGVSGSLLQDRLRERKVESARQSSTRRRSVDPSAERGVQSSPTKGKEDHRPSSSGIAPGKGMGMGVKQAEEQASMLHKQNFDLKLELYHRRQRQELLEAKVEELEKREEQLDELREINDELLAELQRRDQAVEEAVEMIFNLEQKVNRLMEDREKVKAFDADYEPGYYPSGPDFSSSPPQLGKENLAPPKKISRMPSFLSETTEGNEALRSLYLPFNGHSDSALPQLAEEECPGAMDSPRLSVLSESSFVSVYGNKRVPDISLDNEEKPQQRHRASSSVEKWVEARSIPTATPARAAPAGLRKSQFLSINDVLESPLQRLEKLKNSLDKTQAAARDLASKDHRKAKEMRKLFTDQTSFQRQHALPPTPDTISTNTLRNLRGSNDTLHQNHAMDAFPNRAKQALHSQMSIRPRSAGETVTSRREGHGWDTAQEDDTEAGSICSTLSAYSASAFYRRRHQSVVPDLFTFSSGDWGRDYREPALPSHTAYRYESLRRSSMIDHPRSDDTVTNYNSNRYDDSFQYGTTPIDTTYQPELPNRRSSLAAVTKLRKSKTAGQEHDSTPNDSPPVSTPKKSRIPNLRMFGRGDSAPPASPTKGSFSPSLPKAKAQHQNRSLGHYSNEHLGLWGGQDQEEARATPPPIQRSRPPQSMHYRPASISAVGPLGARRFGSYDGACDEVGKGHARNDSAGLAGRVTADNVAANQTAGAGEVEGKTKRWFGLGVGRNTSLKRH
ncbi:hypothetical protein LZ554_008885 [Drepanopeziza brunnea f. sp. 'monogermtubi']|nr:hypothetical protein LZ554_008885 [Drepanopeziza brunnea f. sp. 'monogermtubi']